MRKFYRLVFLVACFGVLDANSQDGFVVNIQNDPVNSVVGYEENSCTAEIKVESVEHSNLTKQFFAIPTQSSHRKPAKICWTFGDGKDTCIEYSTTFSGHYSVKHTYQRGGEYKACFRMVYSDGCVAENCKGIKVEGAANICSADLKIESVTNSLLTRKFTVAATHHNLKKPVKICWTFGDGHQTCKEYSPAFAGPYTVSHTYARGDDYKVCVRVVYADGCVAENCKAIEVHGRENVCAADLKVDAVTNSTSERKFTVVPAHHSQKKPVKICWTFGDGHQTCKEYATSFVGPYTVNHTYTRSDDYKVCVRVVYADGCVAENCKAIEVKGRENTCSARIEVDGFTNSLHIKKLFAIPAHHTQKKPVKVCWTFGDGRDTCVEYTTSFTGHYAVVHNYSRGGEYKACLRMVYADGCVAESCSLIKVHATALHHRPQPQLHLSPNPVIHVLNATFISGKQERVNIHIFNANGVLVRTFVRTAIAGQNLWNFDVSSLPGGVYTLVIRSQTQIAAAIFFK